MRKLPFLMLITILALAGCGQAAPQAAQPTTSRATTAPTTAPAPAAAATGAPSPSSATVPGAQQTPPVPTTPSAPRPRATAEATPGGAPGTGPGLSIRPPDALVAAAQQRLAKRLGVSADTLMLQSANRQEWPDGALGCPKAGQVYPQIVTPGFLLIFSDRSQSKTYEVHIGRSEDQMVLCENNQPIELPGEAGGAPTPAGSPAQPGAASNPLVELARQALAKDLGIKAGDVALAGLEEVEWNDSSLGCPKPGMNYLQVITPGYRITLEAQGRRYEYHSDTTNRVVRCDQQS